MRRLTCLLAIVASTVVTAPVAVAQAACVGLEVQPARIDVDLVNRHRGSVVVRNCEDHTLQVTLATTALGHDLDGTPSFIEDDGVSAAMNARGLGTFTLAPDDTRTVRLDARIPSGEHSLYGGVTAEFNRPDAEEGSSVAVRARVAGMLLMRGPKPWVQTARVVDVGLVPLGRRRFTVHAIVENTGNVHINPTGRMEISRDGEVIARIPLDGGTILPGYRRRLTGVWKPARAPDDRLRLVATISDPAARGFGAADFGIDGVRAEAARITNLSATATEGHALIGVDLRNVGTVSLTPVVQIVLTEGGFERARRNFPLTDLLAPEEATSVQWSPELADGAYTVTARVLQGERLLDEAVTGLRVGEPPAPGSRVPLLALAGFLLLIVLGLLLFLLWRRRSRDEHDPDTPPSGARPLPRQRAETR
jgi:hypothetical protein